MAVQNYFRIHCLAMPIQKSSSFLNQMRAAIRVRHYSIRTEKAYVDWIKRFIRFTVNGIQRNWAKPKS